ncbi:RNA-dependent RNA polymerase 1 [Forsythia ovata]|uniref:RNA-dependent RNA polymerase n=1 Tax=Forsythia ovata TaxID=205694 RepID=A0ABD1W8F8_9LAMI
MRIEEQRSTIRILSTLRNGIVIGDKKFDFLAFSSSQLRDNSVWMFASTANRNADVIREVDGYGGYKGVVAVDPSSPWKLSLRQSMLKYDSENTKLDVLAWSKYQPCFINRQIITLLSTLGVEDHVFEKKQREAVAQLDTILVDPLRAEEALDLMSPGENTNILKEMLRCGYQPDGEPFLSMMLQTFRASKLLDLRVKSRIFVPNARQMMGCLDETGSLEYGQVFVQFSGAGL